ncbi:hypothetical protein C7212DRAFT_358351 [Tuber magnatum]|uniref:Uncharacterized protein n=1 Tax=Tuber magnatum TaxID=42249 RepID=A0A317SLP1_9PEZI|nr:hypothetical protein C7212DRAFT_358351 [Tuber magnatum]
MDNQQSNPYAAGPSGPQRYAPGISVVHNTGSNNNFNSHNATYNSYHNNGGTNSSPKYEDIVRCLYKSDYVSHRHRVAAPAEGTCIWVTKHVKYEEWLEKKGLGLLWLSADPGCGKSVIASFLVGHLREIRKDAIVCYFFFKDDNEEQRSATFALCAILHQLFGKNEPLHRYALEEFRLKAERFTGEMDALWGILVNAAADRECGDVICVVDGLDECESKTRGQLIGRMTALFGSQTSDTPLKFLVTSRPYHEIEMGLGSPTTTIRLKGEGEVSSITADVNRVIEKGIEELESYWEQRGWLGNLRNLLELSADRTFLWVSLVLEILKECEDGSLEEFTEIATSVPRDLPQVYTKILDKTKNPGGARQVLRIVVAAARPLTLAEMHAALRITPDHTAIKGLGQPPPQYERTVKDLCGLFVRIVDSKVYLVHQTAKEFLVKGELKGQGNWQYTLSPADSNLMLADICISYLALQDFENDPLPIDSFSGAPEKLLDSTRRICKGGSNKFLTWLKVYWQNSARYHFTHLMIASWLGQRKVVERLLEEGRDDINERSKHYGTALNIAALQGDKDITAELLGRGAKAYLGEEEYDISKTVCRTPLSE